MYEGRNPNTDRFDQMRRQLQVLLPLYELKYCAGQGNMAANIIREFDDMEQARKTVIDGSEDTVMSVTSYLNHHYLNHPKPLWYRNLTE